MTARIFAKLLLGIAGVLVVAMVGVDVFAARIAESTYIASLERELADKARMIAIPMSGGVDGPAGERARAMAHTVHARLTVVDRDGRVLLDSEADPAHMENHKARAEFGSALSGLVGRSIRKSATTGVSYMYVAVPVTLGALRLALPLEQVSRQVAAVRWRIAGVTLLAFVPAILVAAMIARRMSKLFGRIISFAGELAAGNFHARLPVEGKGEVATLSRRLNDAGEHLQSAVEQLDREHTELEKLERVRKDFVINVSHELRTPLASIQGYTETLIDGAIDDHANRMRFLGIIRKNAERLASLTSDLLTLSRIELQRRNFEFGLHSVPVMLAGAVETVQPMAVKKNLRLDLKVDPECGQAYCDAEAVHQILINLLDNAIKYTPEGGSVAVTANPDGNGLVEISVRDSGIGIPSEDLPRLFERFYRVDKARSREMGGTGLGLAIVKHLVRAQGGDVRIQSVPNEGSTFSFALSSTVHDSVTVQ